MKRVLLLAAIMIALPTLLMAGGKSKKTTNPDPAPKEASEIQWLSIDEIQARMQKQPRKVYMDVYTEWCGWCKKMDAATFTNPDVIKYMNSHYYCFKFDAERKDTIHFLGKEYHYEPQYRCNTLAAELLQGKMSYPTTVLMLENFQSPVPVAGYLDIDQIEHVLTYFGDNAYKHVKWDDYNKTYHTSWNKGKTPDVTPPPGH
jgi:thioredoxin-related protein